MAIRARRERVSVTLSPGLLQRVAQVQRATRTRSRSGIFEEALNLWLREHALKRLESDVEAYYDALTPSERNEDREWSDLAARSAAGTWRR